MALAKEQKQFIENKVKALGSVEMVKQFYKRTSLVCAYANQAAKKLYNKSKLKRRRK